MVYLTARELYSCLNYLQIVSAVRGCENLDKSMRKVGYTIIVKSSLNLLR